MTWKHLIVLLAALVSPCALMQSVSTLYAQQLFVGVNWHPHDVPPEQWKSDIAKMQEAGFNVVRMGHLAWDSYEPADRQFTFDWFDQVMDMMEDAGIKVILDIAVRPAPLWLHRKYPSMDITDADGVHRYPNGRYMEDVGDPMFQEYALRYTDTLTKRYAAHPALLAFGIDNEPGAGKISWSEDVRLRFIGWLKEKYGTTDQLNEAWAAQRWSRRISDFDEIGLPAGGPPERTLDFRRFLSDEINGFYFKMLEIVRRNAPMAQTTTNAWYYNADGKYYDYSPMAYSGLMTREGCGFYPGSSLLSNDRISRSLFGISRIQYEAETPFWCTEFTTFTATPGAVRKYAYLSLMYGNQMVCGWTWQSMHGGEEQFHQGMMDWDGTLNTKYDEYKRIASEFKRIGKHFPYKPKADVALAFSFPSQMMRGVDSQLTHEMQVKDCFYATVTRNIDVRTVDVSRSPLDYKLLIVPGMSVMDVKSAANIRAFVEKGGTVVMTCGSAIFDERGQMFRSTLPGLLDDVFGIRKGGYGETAAMNELSRRAAKGSEIIVNLEGLEITTYSEYFDWLAPQGATVLGSIVSMGKDYPIITSNQYGKGTAIYLGIPADEDLIGWLLDSLSDDLAIGRVANLPQGIRARMTDDSHLLLFNVTENPIKIPLDRKARSLLNGVVYKGSLVLDAQEPEFLEFY